MKFDQHTLTLGASCAGKSNWATKQVVQELAKRKFDENDSADSVSAGTSKNKAFIIQDPHPASLSALAMAILKSSGEHQVRQTARDQEIQ